MTPEPPDAWYASSPSTLRTALGSVRAELIEIVRALELRYPNADDEFFDAATQAQDGVAALDDWLTEELTANPPRAE